MRQIANLLVASLHAIGLSSLFAACGAGDPAKPLTIEGSSAQISIENKCNVPFWGCDELDQAVVVSRSGRIHSEFRLGLSDGSLRVQVYRLDGQNIVFVATGGSLRFNERSLERDDTCSFKEDECQRIRFAYGLSIASPTSAISHRVFLGAFDVLDPKASVGRRGYGFLTAAETIEVDMRELLPRGR